MEWLFAPLPLEWEQPALLPLCPSPALAQGLAVSELTPDSEASRVASAGGGRRCFSEAVRLLGPNLLHWHPMAVCMTTMPGTEQGALAPSVHAPVTTSVVRWVQPLTLFHSLLGCACRLPPFTHFFSPKELFSAPFGSGVRPGTEPTEPGTGLGQKCRSRLPGTGVPAMRQGCV